MKGRITSKTTTKRILFCTARETKFFSPLNFGTILYGEEACDFLRRTCIGQRLDPDKQYELLCIDSVLLKGALQAKLAIPWGLVLHTISINAPTIVFSEEPPTAEDIGPLTNSPAEGWVLTSLLPGYIDEILSASAIT